MAPDRFSIAELRSLTNTVFDALEAAGLRDVQIPSEHGYYWSVLDPFDLTTEAEVGTGEVTDDLLDLRREVSRYLSDDPEDNMLVQWHACVHLASLIQYLSFATKDLLPVERPNASSSAEVANG